jgi:hypothetical protein
MATRNLRANTGYYRRRRIHCVQQEHHSHAALIRWLIVGGVLVLTLMLAVPAYSQADPCEVDGSTANCTDVPEDGIRYVSGITEVNVGDGEEGETVVTPGKKGIELYLYGSTGDSDVDVDFSTILWDTDGDGTTDKVSVVSRNGTDPLMVGDEFILAGTGNPPDTFTIGSDTYSGDELAAFLTDSSVGAGGNVSGFLTVNNEAPFSTTNASGISAVSQGGHGGSGSCWTILLIYTHCNDGSNGGGAGSVAVNNNASITVNGTAEGQHGISAISQGGYGGKGGGFIGLFADAGQGGDGGAGGDVSVTLGSESAITTHGLGSHGVYALSRGGRQRWRRRQCLG